MYLEVNNLHSPYLSAKIHSKEEAIKEIQDTCHNPEFWIEKILAKEDFTVHWHRSRSEFKYFASVEEAQKEQDRAFSGNARVAEYYGG